MKIDYDSLQVGETRYVEPVEINMVKITEYFDMDVKDEAMENSENQTQSIYPKLRKVWSTSFIAARIRSQR